jgi:outer membrane protein assembly factor BamB
MDAIATSRTHETMRAFVARAQALAMIVAAMPVAAAPFTENLQGVSTPRTDTLGPPVALSALGMVLQNGIRRELPGPVVVARDVAGVEAPWSWHVPGLETTVIDWVRPCAAGGALVAGHRDLEFGYFASGRRNLAWVARLDADGAVRWVSDLASAPSSLTVAAHTRIITNLWALPDCGAIAYVQPGQLSDSTRLVALRAEDGAIGWTIAGSSLPSFGGFEVPIAAVGAAFVMAAKRSDGVATAVALDSASGSELWRRDLAHSGVSLALLDAGWVSPTRVALVRGATPEMSAAQSRIDLIDHPTGLLTSQVRDIAGNRAEGLVQAGAIYLAVEESTIQRLVRLDGNGEAVWERNESSQIGALGSAAGGDLLALSFTDTSATYRLQRHAAADGGVLASTVQALRYGYDNIASLPALGVAAIHQPFLSHEAEIVDSSALQLLTPPTLTAEVASGLGPVIAQGNLVLAASSEVATSGAQIVVTAVDRVTGARAWRRALEMSGTSDAGFAVASALHVMPDDTLLVGGYFIDSVSTSPTYGARGVIARLALDDGSVVERTPPDDAKAYRQVAVAAGGDIYAAWRSIPAQPGIATTVGRIVGLQPVWQTPSATSSSRLVATDSGAFVYFGATAPTPGRLEHLTRADGAVAWSVQRSTTPPSGAEALFADGPDTVALLLRTRGTTTSRALQVEQFDRLTGQSRWLRSIDVGTLQYNADASSSALLGDGILLNWSVAQAFVNDPRFAAMARLRADGSFEWVRHYDIAPPGWSTQQGRFALLPDGKLVVAWDADPDPPTAGAVIRLNHLAVVDPSNGELLALKALPSRFESSTDPSGFAADVVAADAGEVVFTHFATTRNGLVAPTITTTPVAQPLIGAPRVHADIVEVAGPRRRIVLLVHASIPGAPTSSRATLRIGLPAGLLASQVTCTADAGARCGGLRRVGAIAQDVELSGAAEVRLEVMAEVIDGAGIESPVVAVLDPEDWMAAKQSRSRVAVVRVPFGRGPDPVFRDGFED